MKSPIRQTFVCGLVHAKGIDLRVYKSCTGYCGERYHAKNEMWLKETSWANTKQEALELLVHWLQWFRTTTVLIPKVHRFQ